MPEVEGWAIESCSLHVGPVLLDYWSKPWNLAGRIFDAAGERRESLFLTVSFKSCQRRFGMVEAGL
jgi:hypothetical protein